MAPSDGTSNQVNRNLYLEELRQFVGHEVCEIAFFETKSGERACDFIRVGFHIFQQNFPLWWYLDLRNFELSRIRIKSLL